MKLKGGDICIIEEMFPLIETISNILIMGDKKQTKTI